MALAGAPLQAQMSVVGSKHDLGNPAGGVNYQVCVFCHTPHGANLALGAPLWNRTLSPAVSFLAYQSTTLDSPCPATPSPISLACLTCHDGVVGASVDKHTLVNPFADPQTTWSNTRCLACHVSPHDGGGPKMTRRGIYIVGNDLRNDHPISMQYPTAAQDPAFNSPPDPMKGWAPIGGADIKLYDGKVECPSCHNPHDPTNVPFLRKTNANDAVCKTCHIK